MLFSSAREGRGNKTSAWVSLTHLHYLRTQSRWDDGTFIEHCDAEAKTFDVLAEGAINRGVHKQYENYYIKFDDYDLKGFDSLASCWIFHTAQNEDIVVPSWEILRAWYLFDDGVMPAVLAGAISDVASLPMRHQPWMDGTGLTLDGKLQYVYPNWLGELGARKFARLYFDAFANSEARKIYTQLMLPPIFVEDGQSEHWMPAVLPPFEGHSRWTVKCIPLQPLARGGNKRWLVLDLQKSDAPLPFSDLVALPYIDTRQGQNAGDPSLPIREVLGKARVLLPTGTVDLVPVAADPLTEDLEIQGFGFDDNITRDLIVHTPEKAAQVSHVIHVPRASVTVTGGATDPAGPKNLSTARVWIKDGDAPFAEDTLLRQTIRAFRLIIDKYPQSRLIRTTESVFLATNAHSRIKRQFAILEMSASNRVAYVLDAQRFGSEEFPFFVCRHPFKDRYPLSVFQTWLSEFPAPRGLPWQVERGLPRGLFWNPRRLKHQPRDDANIERRIRRLAERIAEAMNNMLVDDT